MPIRRIGYACPICDQAGITSHLYESTPSLATRCEANGDHFWTDSDQLRRSNPRKLDLPSPPVTHVNRVALTLQIPARLMQNLETKYGRALNEAVVGLLQYAAQPDFLVIGNDDLERLQDKLALKLHNGSELFGAVFVLGEQIADLKTQLLQLQRAQRARLSGTAVTLDLGDTMEKAAARAAEANMAVDEFLSNYMVEALANDWVTL